MARAYRRMPLLPCRRMRSRNPTCLFHPKEMPLRKPSASIRLQLLGLLKPLHFGLHRCLPPYPDPCSRANLQIRRQAAVHLQR